MTAPPAPRKVPPMPQLRPWERVDGAILGCLAVVQAVLAWGLYSWR